MLLLRKPWDSQPQEVVGVDWGNPLASRIVGGVAIGSGTDVRLARLSGVPVRTVVSDGIAALGSTTGYVTTSGQRGLVGRSAGGTIATHHHTVVIIAHNVGNGFIYDDAGGNTLAIKVESGQLAYRASGATNLFASATPTVPSTGRAVIGLYVGQFGGNQPTVRINGVTHTGSNTTQDSWVAPSYFTWFGSSFFPSANAFVGAGVVALVFSGQLTDAQIDSVGANPWQLFAPRSIWVPVSSSTSGTSYTISPSGGITFTGSGTEVNTKILDVSGGVAFAGTGSITFAGGGTTHTIIPSGGITFGGTGTEIDSKVFIPTGGFTFGGTATIVDGKIFPSSGGISFSGTGSMTSNTTPVSTQTGERTKVGAGA